MPHPYTKEFDTYEECTRWLHERGLSGVLDEMWPEGWHLTLTGDDAKRARNEERPLAPGGFHLGETW